MRPCLSGLLRDRPLRFSRISARDAEAKCALMGRKVIGLVALIATVAENANPLRIGRQARRSTVQDLLGPRGASVRYRSTISARRGGRFYCSADHACDVRSSRGAWPEGSQNLGGLTGRRRRRPQPLQSIRRILETRGDTCLEKYISFGIQSMQRSTLVLLAVR
jgi:hypothetical protein